MPLTTDQIELESELEQLEQQQEEVAQQASSLHPDNPLYDELSAEGSTLGTYIRGVEWAIDNWETDTVTLIGLSGGEFAEVEDELADAAVGQDRQGGQPGLRRVYLVAYGTSSAPYVEDDIDKTLAATSELPLAYLKWAESKVNEMSTVGNESDRKSFSRLLQEKQQDQSQNSTEST